MNFRLGCAIWAYKDWVGDLFPVGSRSADFLSLYSRRFTCVEGNTTFYSIPDAETVSRWAEATPAGFKFCPKLPRELSHQGLLAPHVSDTIAFLNRMQGLGDRLGPVFVQLPPRYHPAQLDDLSTFLRALPQNQVQLAVEVRHPDWFKPEQRDRLNALLQACGVGRVLLDTRPIYDCPDDPQVTSERRKPHVPLQPVITAPFTLIRYISHPERQYNQRFLQEWATQIEQWLRQDQQIYCFVHCPVEQQSPQTARHLQHLLEQQGAPVPPLPWNRLEAAPVATQLSLF
jgi:uncharacterized protein YecE (DUF72 family)